MEPVTDEAEAAPRRRWRRLLVVASVALTVLAGLAASFWFLFVPHWRPPLRDGERYGIDVSSHQGSIDWERVAGDEIEFAYVKATEGRDFTDRYFDVNWSGARSAGLDRGAYHFLTLCSPGLAQAEHFLRIAPPDDQALPPAVDLEIAGNCRDRPSAADVAGELGRFMDTVETAWGRPLVLYVGDDWERVYPTRERLGRSLWHRRFLRRPDVNGWSIWQVHGYARVEGVSGGVDLNVMRPARDRR
jgi:lysozyme